MPLFKPSRQQTAFFKEIQNGNSSIVLDATAGAGKTETILRALPLMTGSKFLGAYSKTISLELAARARLFNSGAVIATLHSAGYAEWKRVAPKFELVQAKTTEICRQLMGDHKLSESVAILVNLAKQAVLLPTSPDSEWEALIDHFGVECLGLETDVIVWAKRVLDLSNSRGHDFIDYDDMIYLPVINNTVKNQYDWVILDEAQDTNKARRKLSIMMLKLGGRFLAVGDPNQAIFGFTGADSDSINQIAQATNAKTMQLSVSFRCPKAVIAVAQKYVPHIRAARSAKQGQVTTCRYFQYESMVVPDDVVLCRYNKPLLDSAYELLRRGIPAKVEGREFGSGLKNLIRRWKSKDFDDLVKNLNSYYIREEAVLVAKGKESLLEVLEDKVKCALTFVEMARNNGNPDPIIATCNEIDQVFSNANGKCVLHSSIHRAKGKEWNRVYWLQTGVNKRAVKDWQKQQERNLCYVAVTRAKEHLILVDEKPLPDN